MPHFGNTRCLVSMTCQNSTFICWTDRTCSQWVPGKRQSSPSLPPLPTHSSTPPDRESVKCQSGCPDKLDVSALNSATVAILVANPKPLCRAKALTQRVFSLSLDSCRIRLGICSASPLGVSLMGVELVWLSMGAPLASG